MTQLSKKIENLNLDSIITRLRRDEHMSTADIQQAVKEYKQFLELRLRESDAQIVPSVLADKVWHHHILDTRKYAEDCDIIFGHFVHHNPHVENLEEHADATAKKLRKVFKESAPAAYRSARCSA